MRLTPRKKCYAPLVALLLTFGPAYSDNTIPPWRHLMTEASSANDAEKEKLYKLALQQWDEQETRDGDGIDILLCLGDLQLARQDLNAASNYFDRAQQVTEKISGKDSPQLLSVLYRKAALYRRQGDNKSLIDSLQRGLAIRRRAESDPSVALEFSLGLFTALEQQQKWEEARQLAERFISQKKRKVGWQNNINMTGLYAKLSVCCWKTGNKDAATNNMKTAIQMLRGNDNVHPLQRIRTTVLAVCYGQIMGDNTLADSLRSQISAIRATPANTKPIGESVEYAAAIFQLSPKDKDEVRARLNLPRTH